MIEATLKTGRTHQIRVHLQALNYPILGDSKYGDAEFNKHFKKQGLNRMFLQCMELSFQDDKTVFGICALLDEDLKQVLSRQTALG